ncbi:MAG TPA: mevalonate kinase [Methanothermococcus okinawensis]|nr:mevalonate kinase [Methanothermococcus okinawensis]
MMKEVFKGTVEVPSKVILFGEHAVVEGYGAISMAVDLKTRGRIFESEKDIVINLRDLGRSLTLNIEDIPTLNLRNYNSSVKYVLCAIKSIVNYLKDRGYEDFKPFKLDISSDIPVSCGLGSSASVVATTIKSFLSANTISIPKKELCKICFSVEREVQGKASITDTATVIYNSVLKIKNSNDFEVLEGTKLYKLLKGCHFLVVHVERRKKKTAELVKEVAEHPRKEEIFRSIGEIVNKVEEVSTWEELGDLMVKNHKLLRELGVSTSKIDKVVELGSRYGYGAKLSGAGGGGVVIILTDEDRREGLLESLRELEVLDVFECKVGVKSEIKRDKK